MKSRINISRIFVLVAGCLLCGALFLPIWRIELAAPQYPEGLVLQIYANGIKGDVEIINGLNHYIGMATLHSKDFIEFSLLPYLILSLILMAWLAFFVNRKSFYYGYIAIFITTAILSMADFYRWEYNYGHHLNPNAAIQVPGMSYQPPLIGYKQLLNFGAFSIPDTGGWLFITAGFLLVFAYLLILRPKWLSFLPARLFGVSMTAVISACNASPEAILYGSATCFDCKMTIIDQRYAVEWVTSKGKVFVFDDIQCLRKSGIMNDDNGIAYFNDYNGKKELQKADALYFLVSPELKSPMGGQTAAFADTADRKIAARQLTGQLHSWSELKK